MRGKPAFNSPRSRKDKSSIDDVTFEVGRNRVNVWIASNEVKDSILRQIVGSGSVVEVDIVAIDGLEIVGNVQPFANVLEVRFQAVASG